MIRFLALTILVTGAPSAALKADPGIEAPTREDVDDRTTDTRFLAAKPTPQVRLEPEEVQPPHPNMNTPPTADDGVAEEMQGQQLEDFLEQRQQMVDMRTAQAAQMVAPGQDTQHHLQPLPPQRQVPGSIADERPLTPDMVSQPKLWDDSGVHQVSELGGSPQVPQQEQEQRRDQEAPVQEAPVPQRGQEVQLQQQLLQQEQEQRRYQEAPVQEAPVPQRGQEVQLQQQLLQQEQEQRRHQEAPVPQRGQEVQLQQQLLQQPQEQPVQQQMVVQGPGYQQQVAVPVAAQTYRHEHNRRNRRPVVQPTQQPVVQPTQQPVVQPTQQLVVQPTQQLPEAQSDRVSYVEPTPASEPATEIRPKGWSQCLKFARDVKKTGVTGPELVRVWEETCQPAVRSGRASDRYRLMCNSLSGAVRPFSAQLDYNVESLCDSVLAIFHDLTASRP